MRLVAVCLVALLATRTLAAVGDVTIGDYRAVVEAPDMDVFRLFHSGVVVREIDDFLRLSIGAPLDSPSPMVAPGTDVNGDGTPDLVLFGWSGGAHCCFTTWVFSLGAQFEELAVVPGEYTEVRVEQRDDDAALEFVVRDWACAYWPYGFAGSPSVEVVLDWQGKSLVPSRQLTERCIEPLGDLKEQSGVLAASASWATSSGGPLDAIFEKALCAVYLGEARVAYEFIGDSWGGSRSEMVGLSVEFGRLLAKSHYLRAIEAQREAQR